MLFGPHWSYNFKNDPKCLGFVLALFANQMSGRGKKVLGLGCSEGIRVSLLCQDKKIIQGLILMNQL